MKDVSFRAGFYCFCEEQDHLELFSALPRSGLDAGAQVWLISPMLCEHLAQCRLKALRSLKGQAALGSFTLLMLPPSPRWAGSGW